LNTDLVFAAEAHLQHNDETKKKRNVLKQNTDKLLPEITLIKELLAA